MLYFDHRHGHVGTLSDPEMAGFFEYSNIHFGVDSLDLQMVKTVEVDGCATSYFKGGFREVNLASTIHLKNVDQWMICLRIERTCDKQKSSRHVCVCVFSS